MPALIFPKTRLNGDPLQSGDQYVGDNGVTYIYDGVKWVGHSQNLTPGTSALVNNSNIAQLNVDGNFELPSFTLVNSTGTAGQTLTWPTTGTVLTWTYFNPSQLINGAYTVELNDDGTLDFPNNTIDAGTSSIAVASYVNSELAWHNNNITGDAHETLDAYVGVDSSGTYIVNESTNSDSTGTNINVWYFDTSGILIFPDNTMQSTAWTGSTSQLANGTWTFAVSSTGSVTLNGTVFVSGGASSSDRLTTGSYSLVLGADGALTFPDATVQTTAWNTSTEVYPHQMVSGSTSTSYFLSAAGTYVTPPERITYDPPTSNPNNITCVFTPTRGDNVVTTTTTIARAFTTATFHFNINYNSVGEWLSISKWVIGVSGITEDGY